MVEMEKRKRLKGVLIKTEPCDFSITSADSSEEMEMNDNGHVSENDYSEMTYDDMDDFEPLKLHVKGEQAPGLEVDSGIATFAIKGTTGSTDIDESNDTKDTITLDSNSKTDICNINQIDDIQFKAMDALSQLNPYGHGDNRRILTEKQFDDILKCTDDMFSDIEAFAAFTDSKNSVLTETNNENDTSLSSEDLPAVAIENNNDSDSILSKQSENNINTKDCTIRDQTFADGNDLRSIKTEKDVDKTLNDRDPIISGKYFQNVHGRSLSGHEINPKTVKQEKITDNSLEDGHCKQTESVPPYERDQGADYDKEDTIKSGDSSENSDFGIKNEKTLPKDCANASSEASQKRGKYRSWLRNGLHPYIPVSDKQQTNEAVSNIQSLCNTFGVPSTQEQSPTIANYLHDKNNVVNIESNINRPLLNAINKLNRNGIRQNLPVFPSVSNQPFIHDRSNSVGQFPAYGLAMQGARLQGPEVNRGTLNQSLLQGPGVNRGTLNKSRLQGQGVNRGTLNQSSYRYSGNQSLNGHYRTPNNNGNSPLSIDQVQQNHFQIPSSGNNPQRPIDRTSSFPGQRVNNRNCVNSRPSQLDFQQSLDDFNIDLLGSSQATPPGSFNNNSSAISNQTRDIYSNRPRNVNNRPSDLCHVNQHSFPPNQVEGHSTNSGHPVQSCLANLPPSYPQGPGQLTQLNPQFSYRSRTISSDATCPQPSAIVHHSPSNNLHSSPKSMQQFTPPRHQTGQHNFSGPMNTSINNHNNLFWKS